MNKVLIGVWSSLVSEIWNDIKRFVLGVVILVMYAILHALVRESLLVCL